MEKGIKIKKATVENIKKIKFAEITPDRDLIIITGGNGQGKSSFSDGIFSVFGGKDSIPKIPLNNEAGKKKGYTKVELTNGLVLTREITNSGTSLKIVDELGKSITSPQTYVNERLSLFSFNPMEFAEADEKNRLNYAKKVLKMVVGKDIPETIRNIICEYIILEEYKQFLNPDDSIIDTIDNLINEKNGLIYMQRRDTNKNIKAIEGVLKSDLKDYSKQITEIESMLGGGDVGYYGEQYKVLKEAHGRAGKILSKMNSLFEVYGSLEQEFKELPKSKEMLAVLGLKSIIVAGKEFMEVVVNNQKFKLEEDEKEIIKLRDDLSRFKTLQESYEEYKESIDSLNKLKEKFEKYNGHIETLKKSKESILKEIKFPVDGMVLEDDDVYVNKLPFSQLSQSEKLMVSVKLAIALNPELRVMRILNGNSLDANTFKILSQIVEEKDFQIWIEWVNEEFIGVGYFFENGEITKKEESEIIQK